MFSVYVEIFPGVDTKYRWTISCKQGPVWPCLRTHGQLYTMYTVYVRAVWCCITVPISFCDALMYLCMPLISYGGIQNVFLSELLYLHMPQFLYRLFSIRCCIMERSSLKSKNIYYYYFRCLKVLSFVIADKYTVGVINGHHQGYSQYFNHLV